jgi:hypothetical protein
MPGSGTIEGYQQRAPWRIGTATLVPDVLEPNSGSLYNPCGLAVFVASRLQQLLEGEFHVRISTVSIIALLVAAISLSACGGSAGIESASQQQAAVGDSYANWQPQQSMDKVLPIEDALRQSAGIVVGGFELIALDSFNRQDSALQTGLRIERSGNTLTIASSVPVGTALLYLRSTTEIEHVESVDFGSANVIGISLPLSLGYQAIGVTAGPDGQLSSSRPLVHVNVAPGPATVERRVQAINDVRNKVGLIDQQKLIAQDDGEAVATLSWRERLTGDYDVNGTVTIADITPLGINLNKTYDKEDPDASPKVEIADGDVNGAITVADITPIGQNFETRIIGYDVYRTALASPEEDPTDDYTDARWSHLVNKSDAGLPSASRDDVPNDKIRLTYTFLDDTVPDMGGDYAWVVVPIAAQNMTPHAGPVSNVARSEVSPKGAPVDLVIQEPATGSLTVGDEFWVAVRITNVIGLFSANMRMEYDGTLLEVVEVDSSDQILPDYVDGAFSGTNMLTDPLFIGIDNVATADNPYVLLGFNDTQKQGTPVVDGSGAVGYVKFRAIAAGANGAAIRWPQSSTFILMWGEEFGVPASVPILGAPLDIVVSPAA